MFILPVHYGDEADYESLREAARRRIPDNLNPRYIDGQVDGEHPYRFYNDVAGWVELRIEQDTVRYTIFAARSHTPPRTWRRDRRLKRRYTWYDMGHWSLRNCVTRSDHVRAVEKCLSVVRKTIPAKFHTDWESWRRVFRAIDWKRLRAESAR